MTSLAAIFVAASAVLGQADERPTTQEHMKVMETFIGTWVLEQTADEDLPAYGVKQGEKYRVYHTYKWLFDGNGIAINIKRTNQNGDQFDAMTGLLYWDFKTKQVVNRWVGRRGASGSTTWTPQSDNTWTYEMEWTNTQGTDRSAAGKVVHVDKDTMTLQTIVVDDAPPDDSEPLKFKRQKE